MADAPEAPAGAEEIDSNSVERRRFLRNVAIAAWSAPVIVSVIASPASAQTASCVKKGKPCSPNGLPCCDRDHTCQLTSNGHICQKPPKPPKDTTKTTKSEKTPKTPKDTKDSKKSNDTVGSKDTNTDSGTDDNNNGDTDDTDTDNTDTGTDKNRNGDTDDTDTSDE